ncbi:N-glycosylase/DNA lyase [Halobacteria archaeon HArc-gm2]|nr:N-glycosylase/DNA lyase [Halobacteria archaeon HArc-gm2]
MQEDRVEAVADAIAGLGYDGIVAFDRTEPEYATIESLYDAYENEALVKLLVVCATTQDYQLNGDAQQFWRKLDEVALDHGTLDTQQDVRDILGTFMEADVNARLNDQKRDRLVRILEAGFDDWFVENYRIATPLKVWERLAGALDTGMNKKTVVLAMKIYDIAHLIRHGEYLEFPWEIPIPCDLQVERVSRTSGVNEGGTTTEILETWAAVMEGVSERLDQHISLLRIDSIVWQAGQIIGEHEPDANVARDALTDHFQTVGIDQEPANELASELTARM